MRSTETTRSPSAVSNTITPWVERPAMRMPSTRVRMSWPPSVTSTSWSPSSTGNEAINLPVFFLIVPSRSRTSMATMPFPPRPDTVFVRRRALAVAALGDREHELLGRRHFHIALLAELDGAARLFGVERALLRLAVDAATDRTRALEIRRALVGARLHVAQDRQRDHPVALGERDAAHAVRGASLEHTHVGDRETNALAAACSEKDVVVFRANLHVDDRVALVELHGDDARRAT